MERYLQLSQLGRADTAVSRFMAGLAARFPKARSLQVVREARQEEQRGAVSVVRASDWLAALAA